MSEKQGGGNKPKDDLTAYKLAYPGDIVINSMNILSGSVGISQYFGCVSPVYYMLRPINFNDDNRFYNYYFRTNEFQKSLLGLGNGIMMKESENGKLNTIRMRIPMDKLGMQFAPITDDNTQREISDYLDNKCTEIDNAISKTTASIEEYKKLKQSIITKAVTKGIRGNRPMKDSGIEWIGKIPEDWQEIQNRYLFRENIRTPDRNSIPLSLSQVDGLIPTEEMKENSLKTSTYDNWKQVRLNDLILNRFKGHLGVLFAAQIEGMVSFHYGVYEPIMEMITKYYEYLFHSSVYKCILGLKSNGMTIGLQNLSNQNFYSVKSIYPSIQEQKEIVEYIDNKCVEIDNIMAKKQQLITELEAYKKSLIYEYVTGKKEVV